MIPAVVRIGSRAVGDGMPVLVIAEAGVNHNGDVRLAHRLIEVAVAASADAVKFQAFVTEELITADAPKAGYQVATTGGREGQFAMLKGLELTAEEHASLKAHCDDAGILYLCTPYDDGSVDLLERLGVAAFKIASTDTTNIPFLRQVAGKGRPVILSTGMSTLAEVEQAVSALRSAGAADNVVLLHCTSEYPAPIAEANLRAIGTLRQAFRCPVGFSDHTPGIGAAPWAVALGACVVEKHLTLDRGMAGPDHRASLEPSEMTVLVQTVRDVEAALGDGVKRPMPSEVDNKLVMQKSLVARRAISAGEKIVPDALACRRPATGLGPAYFDLVVGRITARPISAGEPLSLDAIDWTL